VSFLLPGAGRFRFVFFVASLLFFVIFASSTSKDLLFCTRKWAVSVEGQRKFAGFPPGKTERNEIRVRAVARRLSKLVSDFVFLHGWFIYSRKAAPENIMEGCGARERRDFFLL